MALYRPPCATLHGYGGGGGSCHVHHVSVVHKALCVGICVCGVCAYVFMFYAATFNLLLAIVCFFFTITVREFKY